MKRDDIIGKRESEIFGSIPDFTSWILACGKVALTGQSVRMEQYLEKFGKYFDLSIYSPGKERFAVIRKDITDRKKNENEIHRLNEELEERVKDRTAQLETTIKE